jgi:hypothetical protein
MNTAVRNAARRKKCTLVYETATRNVGALLVGVKPHTLFLTALLL